MISLSGLPIAARLQSQCIQRVKDQHLTDHYIVDIRLDSNDGSASYVQSKVRYGAKCGIPVHVRGNDAEYPPSEIISKLQELGSDPHCLGVLIQLPLPSQLQPFQSLILESIPAHLDIDGLTSTTLGRALTGVQDLRPATVQAVMTLLDRYEIPPSGQLITIIGQSNLVGKPLALALMQRGGQIASFNKEGDIALMQRSCHESSIIISATGQLEMVGSDWIGANAPRVIDVGYGVLDGKQTGDCRYEELLPHVAGITPIPGGVGPVTVASLFANIAKLYHR